MYLYVFGLNCVRNLNKKLLSLFTLLDFWERTCVRVRTRTSHAEDLGSNSIPEIVTYDIRVIVTTSFRRKAFGPEMNYSRANDLVNEDRNK